MSPSLFEQIPQLREDLNYEIARHNLDYADNFRAAIRGNHESEDAYYALAKRGCCGRFDTTTVINGITYMIGCNYGH